MRVATTEQEYAKHRVPQIQGVHDPSATIIVFAPGFRASYTVFARTQTRKRKFLSSLFDKKKQVYLEQFYRS
jgi:hypothetical protein